MKIENKLKRNVKPPLTKRNNVSNSNAQKTSFLEELQQVHGKQIKAKLDKLLDLIDQQGEKLGQQRTFKELIKYKKMVKQFIEEAIEKMYHVQEDYSPTQGKIHTIVKSVDSSLEELTKMIVNNHSAQLDILDQLDEVRGLLIDMYR